MSSSRSKISNSLRLLTITPQSASRTLLPPFLSALTSHPPNESVTTFTGYTSHPPLRLETRYYKADIGVWCDEIPVEGCESKREDREAGKTADNGNGNGNGSATEKKKPINEDDGSYAADPPVVGEQTNDDDDKLDATESSTFPRSSKPTSVTEQWTQQFLSPEAIEVLTVLGAVILLLPPPSVSKSDDTPFLTAARDVRQKAEEARSGADVLGICVICCNSGSGVALGPQVETEETRVMEILGLGWDVVFWDGKGSINESERTVRNEFGELTSIPRILEILEANEWSSSSSSASRSAANTFRSYLDNDGHGHGDDDLDPENLSSIAEQDFKLETNEVQREMFGLSAVIHASSNDEKNDGGEFPNSTTQSQSMDRAGGTSRRSSSSGGGSREEENEFEALIPDYPEDPLRGIDPLVDDSGDLEYRIPQLEVLADRVRAIRDQGRDMPEEERESFIYRGIVDVINELVLGDS